jgi:ABC-type Fe3+-hydroxamate transport system substrate-binding protein
MPVFRDQCDREIELTGLPRRIVSTVPSQTELLADLGLDNETLGLTVWCVHPPHWRDEKKVIGGTKDLNLEKIRELEPDLIIGNKEENIKDQIEALAKEIPVWLSDISTVDEALAMINSIGEICGKSQKANELVRQINQERRSLGAPRPLRVLYFIWKDPYMVAGPNTFISAMMEEMGWQNLAPQNEQRYPQLSIAEIEELNPELILLSSEPYAFTSGDTLAFLESTAAVKIVDGELFSWYGSRMRHAFPYFRRLQAELSLLVAPQERW